MKSFENEKRYWNFTFHKCNYQWKKCGHFKQERLSVYERQQEFSNENNRIFLAKLKCHFRGTKSLIFLFEHNLFLNSLDHQKYAGWDAAEREDGMWEYQPIKFCVGI